MQTIEAVLFDLGETLLKKRRAAGIFCTTAVRFGKSVTMAQMSKTISEVSRQVFLPEEEFHAELLAKGCKVTPYGGEERWLAYFRQVMEKVGLGEKAEEAARALNKTYLSAARWEVHPDAPYALGRLKAGGYKLGVVTNWTPNCEEVLEALGLRQAFDVVVVSEVEGLAKPHPHLFEKALDVLKVAPGATVHVGDDLFYDVGGARAAHVRPLLLDRYHHHDAEQAVRVVHSLREVLELLDARKRAEPRGQLPLPLASGGR
jgi:putative hydrolase of the HAD superfamily